MKKLLVAIFVLMLNCKAIAQTKIYMTKESGVYTVPCKINGLSMKFIFDTGASDVSISMTEAIFMLKNNYLSKDDLGGSTYYAIANGSVAKGTIINLKSIEFGNLKLNNVKASIVHNLDAPLLLGQSVIERLGKIQINGNELTIFNNNTSKKSSSYKVIASNNNPVYFYRTPNLNDRKKAKFTTSEFVNVSTIENGFAYIEFYNTSNQKSTGWIRLSDMQKH